VFCASSSRESSTPNESEDPVAVLESRRPKPKPAYKQLKTKNQRLQAFPETPSLSSTSRPTRSRNSVLPVSPIFNPEKEEKEKKDDTRKKAKGTKGKTKSTFPMSFPPPTNTARTRKSSTFPMAGTSPPKFFETKQQPHLSLSSGSNGDESISKSGRRLSKRRASARGGEDGTRKEGLRPFPLGSQILKTLDNSESSARANETHRNGQPFNHGSDSEEASDLDYDLDEDSCTYLIPHDFIS
jgi:hypothetical protein